MLNDYFALELRKQTQVQNNNEVAADVTMTQEEVLEQNNETKETVTSNTYTNPSQNISPVIQKLLPEPAAAKPAPAPAPTKKEKPPGCPHTHRKVFTKNMCRQCCIL